MHKPETIEDHVLDNATVVSKCTSKAMSIPAAVLGDVLWVAALFQSFSRRCMPIDQTCRRRDSSALSRFVLLSIVAWHWT